MTKFLSGVLVVATTIAFAGTAAAQCAKPKPEASIAPSQTASAPIQLALVMPAQQAGVQAPRQTPAPK